MSMQACGCAYTYVDEHVETRVQPYVDKASTLC